MEGVSPGGGKGSRFFVGAKQRKRGRHKMLSSSAKWGEIFERYGRRGGEREKKKKKKEKKKKKRRGEEGVARGTSLRKTDVKSKRSRVVRWK